jgi:hypothetical protein
VRGTWRPPSLVEKLLSGGGIKVTKGAWKVPKWLALVSGTALGVPFNNGEIPT